MQWAKEGKIGPEENGGKEEGERREVDEREVKGEQMGPIVGKGPWVPEEEGGMGGEIEVGARNGEWPACRQGE